MKVIVYYVDFHWDNHQGGSGRSFELISSVDIPDNLTADMIFDYIYSHLEAKVKRERPFQQNGKYSIQRIEIV